MSLRNILSKENRALMRELVVTDFKLRYQGSVLGYVWSLLRPLLMFAILYVVFGQLLKIGSDIEHYPVYLLLGVVLWSFFVEATTQGLGSIVSRGDLIRKINFPKYIVVVACTVSALINLCLNMLVVLFFVVVSGVNVQPSAFLIIPLVLELYVLALALAFFLSALNVKFRDISHIWDITIQAAFYLTPVLYPMSYVVKYASESIASLMLLSPVAQIIQDAREVLITPQTITTWELVQNPTFTILPFMIILVIVAVGSVYFKRSAKYFAENI